MSNMMNLSVQSHPCLALIISQLEKSEEGDLVDALISEQTVGREITPSCWRSGTSKINKMKKLNLD